MNEVMTKGTHQKELSFNGKTTFCIIMLLIGSVVFWIIRHTVKRYGIKKEDSESSNLMKTHKAGLLKHMYWLLNIIYLVLFERKKSEKKLLYEWKIPGLDTGNSLSEKEKEKQLEKLLTANYTFYQEAVEESRRTEKFKIAFSMVLLTGIFLIVIQN